MEAASCCCRSFARVARINYHGQVCLLLEHRYCRHIESVAGGRLEGPDAALTEDHLAISLRHDILGRHKQLLYGGGKPALEKHRLAGPANFRQQREVLHVAGADLKHVSVLGNEIHLTGIHHLGHRAESGFSAGVGKDLETVGADSLEGVR